MLSESGGRMGIALCSYLAPELLDIMASFIPALLHIRLICIKTTAMLVMIPRFNIDIL